MSRTCVPSPSSLCRFAVARCDITPPVGIYHHMWGAARHDRASGVHRPLTATVVLIEPFDPQASADDAPILVALDHCLFRPPEMDTLLSRTAALVGVDSRRLLFAFSHTHAGGLLGANRVALPGGDLIPAYLDSLPVKIAAACRSARGALIPATISYATGHCDLARHRDYQEPGSGQYVCGYNPEGTCDQSVLAARVTDDRGVVRATLVNYACHPTTLAWENSLISPDFVGAMREVVEVATSAPCVFLQGASGDVGPREGFVGDPAVADRNGRCLGHAALSALEGLGPAGTDFHYTGAVFSGATLGTWAHRTWDAARREQAGQFRARRWSLDLDYRAGLPALAQAERELQFVQAQEQAARAAGDSEAAQGFRTQGERQRRLIERIADLPGDRYPYPLWAWQWGDAFCVAMEGEPYNAAQRVLRERIAPHPVIVIGLANGSRSSYLPTREAYDKPLYQVEIAVLAAGGLERVIDELSGQLQGWRRDGTPGASGEV